MKIEAVTTCVAYSDFLAHSLPLNRRHFDKFVVVSDTKDERTHNLCQYHHIQCVQTDAFYLGDKAFAKGNGINAGLAVLDADDWVMHLDADIVLPPRTREILQKVELQTDMIYGIDRIMCPSAADWLAFVQSPEVQHDNGIFVKANAFPLGVRVAATEVDGYVPIGFSQLWNAGETGRKVYPTQHGTAARADMIFARQWPRHKRSLLPEIVGIHLESETSPTMGQNWRGRTSKPFVQNYTAS